MISSSPSKRPATDKPTYTPTTPRPTSDKPTRIPTSTPSLRPSSEPSARPSSTDKPTRLPVCDPTFRPTKRPFISKPTVVPSTLVPTYIPIIPVDSKKRGIVANGQLGNPNLVNPAWYYNYQERSSSFYNPRNWYKNIPFVPMIKDADLSIPFVTPPDVFLGFNEPDATFSTAFMTPQEALLIWPHLEARKVYRLGAPSCTRLSLFDWFPIFVAGNGTYIPSFDFIPLHWYEEDPYHLVDRIEEVYRIFGKPIWITEFSIADWRAHDGVSLTPQVVINFMKILIPILENIDYVERYAWYSSPGFPNVAGAALYDINGVVTEVGLTYAGLANMPTTTPSTVTPSIDPSSTPTENPSGIPSGAPSSYPSFVPTKVPSVFPSTTLPTVLPSTYNPTYRGETLKPSKRPATSRPSLAPAAIPSARPLSFSPSSIPVSRSPVLIYFPITPSSDPSSTPTEYPSGNPSGAPSSHPSFVPTNKPSVSPTTILTTFLPSTYGPTYNGQTLYPSKQPLTPRPSLAPIPIPSTIPFSFSSSPIPVSRSPVPSFRPSYLDYTTTPLPILFSSMPTTSVSSFSRSTLNPSAVLPPSQKSKKSNAPAISAKPLGVPILSISPLMITRNPSAESFPTGVPSKFSTQCPSLTTITFLPTFMPLTTIIKESSKAEAVSGGLPTSAIYGLSIGAALCVLAILILTSLRFYYLHFFKHPEVFYETEPAHPHHFQFGFFTAPER